jgi:multiple sugar transport system ATP-binding protein
MRAELIELHDRLQATMIYVTHDQVEAMTMGDKIVVMRDGKVQQIGSPLYMYNNPINKFVAGFIGSPPMNFLTLKVVQEGGAIRVQGAGVNITPVPAHAQLLKAYIGKEVSFGVRPEDLIVDAKVDQANVIKGKVTVVEPLGAEIHLQANINGQNLIARLPPDHLYKHNDSIEFIPTMEKARYFDRETENSILPVKWDEQA